MPVFPDQLIRCANGDPPNDHLPRGTFRRRAGVAGVDGPGHPRHRVRLADLIAVDDDGVRVLPSTGAAFGAPEQWSTQPFFGERVTLAGDVDADGDTDLIAVNTNDTMVMLAE